MKILITSQGQTGGAYYTSLQLGKEDDFYYAYRPYTPWAAPYGVSLARNRALRVTFHLKCPRHEYEYDPQDFGFSRSLLSDIPENRSHIADFKELEIFKKEGFDQMASRKASLDIFRLFSINGEGLPPEKIYQDDSMALGNLGGM